MNTKIEPEDEEYILERSETLFIEHQKSIYERTDRIFAGLMLFQWICSIAAAYWIAPLTWEGVISRTHLHVWASIFLGGAITLFPVFLALTQTGNLSTRYVIAVGQMMMSALLIHLTGGRIETHFHVFGSLAFLAFYRDWQVFIPATIVVALDHFIRGVYWPQSVYGVLTASPWRSVEHAAWVVFEDIFLIISCRQSIREMWAIARQRSELEETNQKIELKVLQRTEELRKTLAELAEKNKKLQEAEQIKSQFLANVSHELRTPLTLTLSPLESLLSEEYGMIPESQKPILKSMHNNAVRLLQMVTGLLDFSKLEAGKIQLHRESTPILSLTRSVFSDFKPALEQKGLEAHLEELPNETVVEIDRYIYERILFNLLSNAFKFTPHGGKITVSLKYQKDQLQLSVSDTGVGISDSEIPNLFLRFHQIEGSSTRRFEGTGLGLSLVKQFAEVLKGRVTVESKLGKGSTFRVELFAPPSQHQVAEAVLNRSQSTLSQVYETSSATETEDQTIFESSNYLPKLLIVEDNMELANYISSLLKDLCKTKIAQDGDEALKFVEQWSPDLILSDVMMPKRDGFSLCKEIKSNKKTAQIPVILLTALTHREALLKGWESGADEYLFKPFHPKELLTRIKSILTMTQIRKESEKIKVETVKMAAVGQLAAGVAHEINNPLGVILGFAQGLTQRLKPGDTIELPIKSIEREAKRCKNLVQDLLTFSRTLPIDREALDLNRVIESALHLSETQAKMVQIEIKKELAEGLPRVLANSNQIQQVVINLSNNALDAMAKGGTLTISTRCHPERSEGSRDSSATPQNDKGSFVEISVSDTGSGIPAEALPRIFDPFFTTKPVGKGTGLGLSLVYEIVQKHGGTIEVKSEQGKGTTVRILLPTGDEALRK